MQKYIHHKEVPAEPMSRGDCAMLLYAFYEDLSDDMAFGDEGYLVTYSRGTPEESQTWLSKEDFEEEHTLCSGAEDEESSLKLAVISMVVGKKAARTAWNCEGQHIRMQTDFTGTKMMAVYFCPIQNIEIVTPWLPCAMDILTNDWIVLD